MSLTSRPTWGSSRRGRLRHRPFGQLRRGAARLQGAVAEVGLGHVGLVLGLEVSRFARSSADWHQLLDLCALTGTLIADSDGVDSPADFNDRLLLGLKGTISQAELHLIRARLDGGLPNKAERGELRLALPVGLDRDEDDRVVLCSAEAGELFAGATRPGVDRALAIPDELLGSAPSRPRQRPIPKTRSGDCFENTSAPASARE